MCKTGQSWAWRRRGEEQKKGANKVNNNRAKCCFPSFPLFLACLDSPTTRRIAKTMPTPVVEMDYFVHCILSALRRSCQHKKYGPSRKGRFSKKKTKQQQQQQNPPKKKRFAFPCCFSHSLTPFVVVRAARCHVSPLLVIVLGGCEEEGNHKCKGLA